jgi:UDP-N-acetylmuramoylalanine--D-glutamate ligase
VIPLTTFAGKTLAVFGLGSSGLASCAALQAGGAKAVGFDDDPARVAAAASRGIATADLRQIDWSRIAALVLSPGVPLTHPAPHWSVALARDAGVEIVGDIELYCRERRAVAPAAPFVAVTGTNGKSTTTALIAHVLTAGGMPAQRGGNIGVAVLSLDPPALGRAHVIECSSYQIDLAKSLDPAVGILLNVSPDHLDRHGGIEQYAAIKARLVEGVPGNGAAIVGVDDEWSRRIADRLKRAGKPVTRVSVLRALDDGLYVEADRIMEAKPGRAPRAVADIGGIGSLRGRHNAQNAACATAAALALGLAEGAVQRGLRSFPGLAHRMEQVGRRGRVLFVNDSKATNADAAARALASFSDIFWIAGGRAKSGGIAALAEYFPRIRKAYLVGEAADAFAATLGGRVVHEKAGTLERAVARASRDAEQSRLAEPVVLLSPACASFDQFPNFEIRGSVFRELVRELDGLVPVEAVEESA